MRRAADHCLHCAWHTFLAVTVAIVEVPYWAMLNVPGPSLDESGHEASLVESWQVHQKEVLEPRWHLKEFQGYLSVLCCVRLVWARTALLPRHSVRSLRTRIY